MQPDRREGRGHGPAKCIPWTAIRLGQRGAPGGLQQTGAAARPAPAKRAPILGFAASQSPPGGGSTAAGGQETGQPAEDHRRRIQRHRPARARRPPLAGLERRLPRLPQLHRPDSEHALQTHVEGAVRLLPWQLSLPVLDACQGARQRQSAGRFGLFGTLGGRAERVWPEIKRFS